MIPQFPEFKKLELSDKDEIESFTKQFPPYSDFNFVSMYSWNIKNEMGVSILNDNLVIRFTDYLTGDPVYSFLGFNKIVETTEKLVELGGFGSYLNFLPKEIVEAWPKDNSEFEIEEDLDHNDYIYSVDSLINYDGSLLKNQRNLLSGFIRKHPQYSARVIDLTDKATQESIIKLYRIWESNKGNQVPHEFIAISNCISHITNLPVFGIGLFVENELIAFNINQIDNADFATCFFAKGNIQYTGVYSALMNETAKILSIMYKVKFFNYEQDLGLFNLRKSKESFNPIYFLKKYCVFKKA